jgi:hypothetical protein
LNFVDTLVNQIVNADPETGGPDEARVNFMLAVVEGMKPEDKLEAMHLTQMAAVHGAAMKAARTLAGVKFIDQQDSAMRAFTKLTNTFTSQMLALKRYRSRGEQRVIVQHINVADGGQAAVVGSVGQPSAELGSKKASESPPQIADAGSAAMPILNDKSERVEIPAIEESGK